MAVYIKIKRAGFFAGVPTVVNDILEIVTSDPAVHRAAIEAESAAMEMVGNGYAEMSTKEDYDIAHPPTP